MKNHISKPELLLTMAPICTMELPWISILLRNSQNTLRRKMDEYITVAKVKRITPHQFRHSHASLIFSMSDNDIASAYATADRLGNNIKYTLETYGDLYKSERKKILKKLNF
jgi:integrase